MSSLDEDAEDLVSVSSYASATSKGMSSAKSVESITDTRSMVTAVSGSDVDRAPTPTENDPSLVISIADELAFLREENRQLKEERERTHRSRELVNGSRGDGGEADETNLLKMLEERLNEAESCIQDYRDENTVLKCELRELQENTYTGASESALHDKLKQTETLCEELMEENETLKADVKDLQQEIEEMQDQYREEEIDEFRELQRELEQHAKNSRVLQFKLRKSDRAREQTEAELTMLKQRLDEMTSGGDYYGRSSGDGAVDSSRVRELESELKIAKEVSVRLHGELEQTEEKRYRLEDEVFYLKEKIREMQTQNKWREARNKTEAAVKRLSAELSFAPQPLLPSDDMNKELRDALEREIDLREQLRYAEEDLKRTQLRLQDVENENEVLLKKATKASSKHAPHRPPMVRSASEGNAHLQLELAEHEVEHLSTKVKRLESTNDHLSKKIASLESDSSRKASLPAASAETPLLLSPASGSGSTTPTTTTTNGAGAAAYEKQRFQLTPEMERDMAKLIGTIADLEKKNRELSMQLRSKGSAADDKRRADEPDDPVATNTASSDLRCEQERRRGVEAELTEMKQMLLKTDNQKLIGLATKVEVLQSQLSSANERCTSLHKKHVRDADNSKYLDDLKERCEKLERQLSEQKAAERIAELQGKVPTADDIESCCEMLATVEAQTARICKQIERIDSAQKDERRRSLSKDSGATIIAELANVMDELKSVHGLLDAFRANSGGTLGGTLPRRSPFRDSSGARSPVSGGECGRCKEREEDAEKQRQEVIFYKKKNKDLTEQVLQTEDRWTIEIEKQRGIFENEIKTLGGKLADARRQADEQSGLLDARTAALAEKTKVLDEQCERSRKLQRDLEEAEKRAVAAETEKKSAREFEIKYKKLEGIFDQERAKMNTERGRSKAELTALRKAVEEAEETAGTVREDLAKKEVAAKAERAAHEREISSLKRQLQAARAAGGDEDDTQSRHSSSAADAISPPSASLESGENALTIELRKQLTASERKVGELQRECESLRIANVDIKSDLDKMKATWTKDKEAFTHKQRQTEKIRSVEMDALQQKFSSRMRIMEDTNKSLHSQLVLARRARDAHKDEATAAETALAEEKRKHEASEKALAESVARVQAQQKRLADLEAELERTHTELRLTKEAKKADQILWNMEKGSKKSSPAHTASGAAASATDVEKAEAVRAQYAEYEKFYAKEVERLTQRVKDMAAEAMARTTESQKTIRELREHIRLLEIDKRNLTDTRETGAQQREMLESEQQRLQQAVHMCELQKLTRKYRLSSIIDQLQYVSDTRRGLRLEVDHPDSIRYIISQLAALRDEDAQILRDNGDDRSLATNPPSVIFDPADNYDNISQSSMSIRSTASGMPLLHHSARLNGGGGSSTTSSTRVTTNGNGGGATASASLSARATGGGTPSVAGSTTSSSGAAVPRSVSMEGGHWDSASLSSARRKISYPDPPPNFLLSPTTAPASSSSSVGGGGGAPPASPTSAARRKAAEASPGRDSHVEYDAEGRRHITRAGSAGVVNPLSRSTSYDRRGMAPLAQPESPVHFRTSSAGSNILYQVRREELARGGQPSVRLMARAFDSFDDGASLASGASSKPAAVKKRSGLFGSSSRTKSASVDQAERQSTTGSLNTQRSAGSNAAYDDGVSSTSTLPRGGRNPFKSMGTAIVERVRRSLSRSSRREKSRDRSETAPPSEMGELPRDGARAAVDKASERGSTSPKKAKKKAAESKARKTTALTGVGR